MLSLHLLNAPRGLRFLYKPYTSVTEHFKHLGLRWGLHTIFQLEKFKIIKIYEAGICMVNPFRCYWRGLSNNKWLQEIFSGPAP